MRILYIGQIVSEEKKIFCSAYSVPGNFFQKKMLEGITEQEEVDVTIISTLPKQVWPGDKLLVDRCDDQITRKIKPLSVGYINLPILKQIAQMRNIVREGLRVGKEKKFDVVLVYNMYPQFGCAALKLSKKLGIPLVSVLADFPNDSGIFFGGNDGFLTKVMNAMTWRNIKRVKYGIVLNKNVSRYMASDSRVMVVPGIIEEDVQPSFNKSDNYDLVYAGALTNYSGIINLIEAVNKIDIPKVHLRIFGRGELEETIKTKTNERISYEGSLPLEEMRKVLRESWVLVNPRSTVDFVSTVTFPSKILEYIMCGRPVISTEFSGIPEEIRDVIWGCGNGTPDEICDCIKQIYNFDENELNRVIKEVRDKVIRMYNKKTVGFSILLFLEKILGEQ